ncbi:uncharacterized protein LOC105838399 [Monomorium pharaonis]|uniref:uncharacterized protein LOC105838399 n=1 Tax=Monomorium pharaonis TaxID=307658 RepID=UPI00174695BB|nr:uncharacterized protein LOC105838399 [Monomorium pharaonis]
MRMEQIRRHKTKYTSPNTFTWSANQTTNARVPPDAYWKYTQRSNQDATDKNTRRHQSPMPDSTVSYYSSANSYKPSKYNAYPCSTHPKDPSALYTEVPQRYQQITTKSNRNKDHINNVAVINKDRYKTQQEDENNIDYNDEELGNFTEDNLEEDTEVEAKNDRSLRSSKRVDESTNKDYNEQEADDEIDEESDAPTETEAMQRNSVKKEALQRAQRMRLINQLQDPHKIRYPQQSPKQYQAYYSPTRYYHNTPDHETLSEEDMYTVQALKNPPRRSLMGYPQNWIPQRNATDRYDTLLTQPCRRAWTRPEAKSFTEAELTDRKKCSRCGNISTKKLSTSRRDNRFQDNPNFSTKTHFGNDAKILDQSWCGHCKPNHHFERNMGHYEIPTPALYSMKSRRSRDTNIPMHETLEKKHPVDEISHEFARMSSGYTKDTPNTLYDRTRHSVPTTQPANRISARYNT